MGKEIKERTQAIIIEYLIEMKDNMIYGTRQSKTIKRIACSVRFA